MKKLGDARLRRSTPIILLALALLLARTPLTAQEIPAYDRDAWPHWVDLDGDCQDARAEALIAAAGSYSTESTDPEAPGCRVVDIVLIDPYSGALYAGPARLLDIDHVVPLSEAHRSGGWAWSEAVRRAFANDPLNLLPTASSLNRGKGSRDPAEWLPPDPGAWCWYGQRWAEVKAKYALAMDGAEVAAVVELLRACARGFTFSAEKGYTCREGGEP